MEHLSSDFPSTLKNQKNIDYPIDNDKEYPTDEEEPFEKKPKKRALSADDEDDHNYDADDDSMSFSSGFPPGGVNKVSDGGSFFFDHQQSTKTGNSKAPPSVDASRKVTVPRTKAATIVCVRRGGGEVVGGEEGAGDDGKTYNSKAPPSVDASRTVTVPRTKAATIVCVRGGEERGEVGGGISGGSGRGGTSNGGQKGVGGRGVGDDDEDKVEDDNDDEGSKELQFSHCGGDDDDDEDDHDDEDDDGDVEDDDDAEDDIEDREEYDGGEASGGLLLPATGSRVSLSSSSNNSVSQFSLSTQQGAPPPNESRMFCPAAGKPLPVVRSFPRQLYTQVLPKYNYLPETAPSPVRDSIVTYKTMETGRDIILDSKEPFGCSGIASLQSYVKRGRGLAWQNRSSSKLHYETNHRVFDEHTRPKAKLLKIRHHIFYPDGGTVRQVITGRDNAFIIVSGGTFADFHDKVCFQALIRDACIPAVNTIPKQDSLRMNSGPTVGLSSSQGTTRSPNQGFATPNFIHGTHRYSKIFGIASETTRKLLKHCRLSWLLPPTGPLASRKQLSYQHRCEELCQGNLYLALSFKVYVHHPANIDNHAGHFSAHRDVHNPHYNSPNDIFFTAWDTWFEPLLNLYVTGTIIFCGRRSQEELYDRILKIGRATEEILSRAHSLPISRRSIHPDMLCPSHVEFMTQGSHLLQIHALTPNEYIYQLAMVLGGNQGLSAFLATEIILGYHQTSNNALRFHRFMNQLLSSVQQHRDLRFLGQLNVIEAYQQYCYNVYGSFEGTTDRNGLREGLVRHQPSHTNPISHYANWYSLQALVSSLKSNGSLTICNQRRYESLVKQLKLNVIGLGDLKGQKTVITCASVGLYINIDFMSNFYTGSTQQLKNLKEDPFNFNRADEVTQLRRNLCVRMPHLLPMQADEFICALTSGQKKKSTEETTGELYYTKQSIFNATRQQDGTVSVRRFNWSRKQNEPAPNIKFNYSQENNH